MLNFDWYWKIKYKKLLVLLDNMILKSDLFERKQERKQEGKKERKQESRKERKKLNTHPVKSHRVLFPYYSFLHCCTLRERQRENQLGQSLSTENEFVSAGISPLCQWYEVWNFTLTSISCSIFTKPILWVPKPHTHTHNWNNNTTNTGTAINSICYPHFSTWA